MSDFFEEMWRLLLNGDVQGIWFWAAVYVFGLCVYSTGYQFRIRSWPSTTGKLLKRDIERFAEKAWGKSEQQYIAKALYRYDVDGKTLMGHRVSPWVLVTSHNAVHILAKQLAGLRYLDKDRVVVFYHPTNPSKSYLVVPSVLSMLLTMTLGGLPLMLFYANFYW